MLKTMFIAAAAATALAGTAHAEWPEEPIEVVVPFGPGGTTDVVARNLQKVIQDEGLLPQPITITNVGGHFSVGATQVKNAEPDGYTFLLVHLALLSGEVVDPGRDLSYRDLEPVALTGGFCLHPVVRSDSPYETLEDLTNAATEEPNTIVFGVNIGALNHMGAGFIENATDAEFRFVQIGGGAENYAALRGGQTQATMLSSSEYQRFKGDDIRALGYTGAERLELEPDMPTMRDAGLDFDFCINNYWFAPAGTPQEAIDGLAAALEAGMQSEAMQEAQARNASTTEFLSGDAFREHLDETFERVEPVASQLVTN